VLLPDQIAVRVPGWDRELAWESEPATRTWRLTGPGGQVRYLKTRPADAEPPLRAEVDRMRWAGTAGLAVPRVVASCQAAGAEWLLTEALEGKDATRSSLRAEPERLVSLLAAGLRAFHGTPAAGCPFAVTPQDMMARAAERVRAGLVAQSDLDADFAGLTPLAALAELTRLGRARLDAAEMVVCHGDYSLPNVLISAGQITGFIDLGSLAVADRWSDLAGAALSVTWNLGPEWVDPFLASYGAERDDEAIRFYRLCDGLGL